MFVFNVDVQPLRDAQLANLALMREIADGGDTDHAIIADIAALLLPTIFAEMPKATGTAAAAQTPFVSETFGSIFTDPSARNPISGAPPDTYLPFVFDRLGEANPYAAAIAAHADEIPAIALKRIGDAVEQLL